jgi:ribosomal protein L21
VTLPAHPERIYAVFRLGNRQFKVTKDDRVMVEMFSDESEVGQ